MQQKFVGAAAAALIAATSSATAQSITPLVLEGQVVTGIGAVTGIQRVAVNDSGQWLVEVDTDNADTAVDEVLIQGGVVLQQQGRMIAQPAGATLVEFVSQDIRANGDVLLGWSLSGTTGGTTDNSAIYINTQLVLQKGATPLGAPWGAGTVYTGFTWSQFNAANQVFLRGTANDPTTAMASDSFASIVQFDGANTPVSETVLARSEQILPMQAFPVNTIGTSQDGGEINASGQAIFRVSLTGGAPGTSDSVVYLWNGASLVLLAQEGLPSPVVARTWGTLVAPELTLNNAGDWVIKDQLDSTVPTTQDIIVKNNVKFVQEGDNLPAIGGFTFTTFGNTGVSLTSAGNVCWYGDWNDANAAIDTGIFVDQALVVQEGVTPINGSVFNSLAPMGSSATAGQNNVVYISPSGRYLIFTGQIAAGSVLGAFLLDREAYVPFCAGDGNGTPCPCGNHSAPGADEGCLNSFGQGAKLRVSGSNSLSNDTLVLLGTQMPDAPGLYFQGTAQINAGLGAVFGDGLRCAGGSVVRLTQEVPVGGSSQYPSVGDPPVSVRGLVMAPGTRNYQIWYRNVAAFCTPDGWNLSNGMRVQWAP